MNFQRIDPDKLNGRQKEIYNFQKSAALLADYGFNCIKLTDDWKGADFLAHHFDGNTTLCQGRRILTRAGIGSPRSRRSPQHRFRRQRMPQAGMLVQLDGSHHA